MSCRPPHRWDVADLPVGRRIDSGHEQVIEDYRACTSGFVQPRNRRISRFIDEQFAEGVQWPDLG